MMTTPTIGMMTLTMGNIIGVGWQLVQGVGSHTILELFMGLGERVSGEIESESKN